MLHWLKAFLYSRGQMGLKSFRHCTIIGYHIDLRQLKLERVSARGEMLTISNPCSARFAACAPEVQKIALGYQGHNGFVKEVSVTDHFFLA